MPTLTVYPVAGHASTTSDEGVARASVDESLAVIRAGAGTDYGYPNFIYARDGTTATVAMNGSSTTNQFAALGRFFATFDTSSLGVNAVISSAVLSLYGSAQRVNLGSPNLHITAATPTSKGNVAVSDFSQVGNTSFGSLANSSWVNSAYNDISLSTAGIATINLTGLSAFALRLDWDLNNAFTGVWATDSSSFEFKTADSGVQAQTPKLTITYSITVLSAGGGIPSSSINNRPPTTNIRSYS